MEVQNLRRSCCSACRFHACAISSSPWEELQAERKSSENIILLPVILNTTRRNKAQLG